MTDGRWEEMRWRRCFQSKFRSRGELKSTFNEMMLINKSVLKISINKYKCKTPSKSMLAKGKK